MKAHSYYIEIVQHGLVNNCDIMQSFRLVDKTDLTDIDTDMLMKKLPKLKGM